MHKDLQLDNVPKIAARRKLKDFLGFRGIVMPRSSTGTGAKRELGETDLAGSIGCCSLMIGGYSRNGAVPILDPNSSVSPTTRVS